MTERDQPSKIDFARSILDHNISLINLADTKAGILLGINGVILALLFGVQNEMLTYLDKMVFLAAGTAFGVSGLFSFLTLIPRLNKDAETSKIYFLKIKETRADEFIRLWDSLTPNEILKDYLLNIHSIAVLQTKKYNYLQLSTIIIIIGFGFLIVALFFYLSPYEVLTK